jgi:hypothetical protein
MAIVAPSDLETSVRSAAQNLADALRNATELRVETLWVQVGNQGPADFSGALPVAQTVIELNGDSRTIIPMHTADSGVPNLDERLLDLHQRAVGTAIQYRAGILSALLTTLRARNRWGGGGVGGTG